MRRIKKKDLRDGKWDKEKQSEELFLILHLFTVFLFTFLLAPTDLPTVPSVCSPSPVPATALTYPPLISSLTHHLHMQIRPLLWMMRTFAADSRGVEHNLGAKQHTREVLWFLPATIKYLMFCSRACRCVRACERANRAPSVLDWLGLLRV